MSDESSAFMEDLSPEHFMGEALKEACPAYDCLLYKSRAHET